MRRRDVLLGGTALLAGGVRANAQAMRRVIDQLGRTVQLPATVQRVVALQHQALDIVVELGAADRVVGVLRSWQAQIPEMGRIVPGLAKLPTPGDLTSANIEELLALRPDVVFVTNYAPAPMIQNIARAGLPVAVISLSKGAEGGEGKLNPTFAEDETAYTEGLKEGVALIGSILGTQERAQRLVDAAFAGWEMAGKRVADVPQDKRTRLYMANPDLQTYGSGKFTGVMMQHSGGQNVAQSVRGWSRVSMEDVLRWNPQVIFVQDRYASVADEIKSGAAWAPIDAVRYGRIYITPEYVKPWGYPLPEAMALGAPWMGKKLYPDRFADYDLQAAADQFYRTFYGIGYTGPN